LDLGFSIVGRGDAIDFEKTRPGRADLRLRVAGEVAFDAFWQETLSAALTTARERRASAFGPHPRAKSVLLFARSFRWLISAFHKAENSRPRELRAVTLEVRTALSIPTKH